VPSIAVGLVVIQVALGISNVLTYAVTWSAIGHLTVASWLWTALITAAAFGLTRPVASEPYDEPNLAARDGEGERIDEEATL
jgi:heme A synthase